jgi:hypothetical protein
MYFARPIEDLLGPKNKVARWLSVAESAVSRYLDGSVSLPERWQVDRRNAGAADPMGGFRSLASVPAAMTVVRAKKNPLPIQSLFWLKASAITRLRSAPRCKNFWHD